MKNKLRSVKSGSKKALPAQSINPKSRAGESAGRYVALFKGDSSEEIVDLSEDEFRTLDQAAKSSGVGVLMFMANSALSLANGRDQSPEGLERWKQMRDSKLNSPVHTWHLASVNFEEDNDVAIIWLLAEMIHNYSPEMVSRVMVNLSDRKAAYFGEVLQVAGQIFEDPRCDRPSEIRTFCLPGLSGEPKYKSAEVLFLLATLLDDHRELIRKEVLVPMTDGLDKCLFAEALALATSVMDRASGNVDIENYEAGRGPAPQSFQDAWKAKADYYRQKLTRQAAEQSAVYDAAKAADARMLAHRPACNGAAATKEAA
jgi:hypothetical protein